MSLRAQELCVQGPPFGDQECPGYIHYLKEMYIFDFKQALISYTYYKIITVRK